MSEGREGGLQIQVGPVSLTKDQIPETLSQPIHFNTHTSYKTKLMSLNKLPDAPSSKPPASPTFPDTDVPMACLFIHFEHGYTLSQFLLDFPTVQEEDVQELMERVIEVFKTPNLMAAAFVDLTEREEEEE